MTKKNTIGYEKELAYQKEYKPHLALLPGLQSFIEHYHTKNIKMAIDSAAIMFYINFVLDGLNIRTYFDAIVSADDVTFSKPHHETFTEGAAMLNIGLANCLVFEDNPKGVEAAQNAGMETLVITTPHQPYEFEQFNNIISFHLDFTAVHFH